MSKANSRFQQGSGVYKCGCCGRKTRATGDDSDGVGLCSDCYEMAGIENQISDGGYDGPEALAVLVAEVERLKDVIISKGGKLS